MDLRDTPEQAEFRAECRDWIEDNAPRHLDDKLRASSFGRSAFAPDEYLRESKSWQAKKADAGWACLHWPKEYGGRDATPIQRVIWGQEEGLYAYLSSLYIIGHGMCAPTLMAYASEEQKRRYLPPMARGAEIWCQLFSEPAAGSDLAGIRTRAERDGDEWIINGQKVWTSGAHNSEWGILVARSDTSVAKHKGMTFFFLDMRSPGIEIRPIRQAAGEAAFNEVFFTNVRIPDAQRLGEVGEGWNVSLTTLMNERAAIGTSMATGWDEIYALTREIAIESGAALEDAEVRQKLGDWYVRAMGLRYTGYRSISALSKGQLPGPENSIGKVVAGNMMQEIASFALDLQDASGALLEPGASPTNPTGGDFSLQAKFPRILMRSLGTRIEGGTDEILKNIIAERVLGLPGDVRVDRDVPFSEIPGSG